MKRRMLAAATLLLCLIAATAQAMTVTGYETESVTREWENNAFFARMREMTGVETLPHGIDEEKEYKAAIDGMLKGEIPADMLFKAALSRETETALLDVGAIIDLAPLIEENMPNLSALLEAHPQWRRSITLADGRIPSLPQLNETERQVCVWINRAWLDKLGLAMPQTVGELTDALLAMKSRDPNGNGDFDEIAADLTGVYEMRWLLPLFGVIADDYNVARDAQGDLVFAPELPQYREFVATLRGWYEQGILTSEAFTDMHSSQAYAAASSNNRDTTVKSGLLVTVTPYTHIDANSVFDFEPLLLAGPDGSVRWRDMLGGVWTGCFAVTSTCEDPAAALRWADMLYSEEGARLAYAGVEGVDYDFSGENWMFIVNDLRTVETLRAESIIYTGEIAPGIVPNDFLRHSDSEIDRYVLSKNEAVQAVAECVTVPYLLSAQDQARANALSMEIGSLVDRGIARFITGELELSDENWNAWLDSLREAGSAELTALFAAAE